MESRFESQVQQVSQMVLTMDTMSESRKQRQRVMMSEYQPVDKLQPIFLKARQDWILSLRGQLMNMAPYCHLDVSDTSLEWCDWVSSRRWIQEIPERCDFSIWAVCTVHLFDEPIHRFKIKQKWIEHLPSFHVAMAYHMEFARLSSSLLGGDRIGVKMHTQTYHMSDGKEERSTWSLWDPSTFLDMVEQFIADPQHVLDSRLYLRGHR